MMVITCSLSSYKSKKGQWPCNPMAPTLSPVSYVVGLTKLPTLPSPRISPPKKKKQQGINGYYPVYIPKLEWREIVESAKRLKD